jgi:AcrR family transcriptional regulator
LIPAPLSAISLGMKARKKRLKAPQRRQQLVEVATRIFARHGYDATTTHAIAEAARVTEPILYRHFKSKEELFFAITRQMSKETLQHWKALIAHVADPVQQIRAIAREFPKHLDHLADAYHVIHGALATSSDTKVRGMIRKHYSQIESFFVAIIKQGQQSGQFRSDVDPKVPAWHLIHLGIGYAMIKLNVPKLAHFPIADGLESVMHGIQSGRR